MRTGWFTPTEAAVMAVVFGLFVGFVVYRSLTLRALYELLVESAETSAVILVVVGLASVFAWACSTLGIVDPIARGLVALGGGQLAGVIIILMVFLVIVGMFLDGISIFLIFCPLFVPIARRFDWDLVWFGVLMTYNDRDRPVHPAHGGQPHGELPAQRRPDGRDRDAGTSGCCSSCSSGWCDDLFPGDRALAAAGNGVYVERRNRDRETRCLRRGCRCTPFARLVLPLFPVHGKMRLQP